MRQILLTIFMILILFLSGVKMGVTIGEDRMYGKVIDSVNSILDQQLKSDTSVTRLVLINSDTNTYILQRKTFLPSKY